MEKEQTSKIVLVDGHSILNRAFYGMPDLTNAAGVHTGAVYGFLRILFKILGEEQADYLTVAFDVHAPTFRHEAYPEYKGNRSPMPPELREQVPLIQKVLAAMGIEMMSQAGLEADDILGTLAKRAESDGMEVSLVSGDRDLLQIASDRICVRIPKTKQGQTVTENYYADDVLKAYKVTPTQFIDVKALMGDSSDNVPGVPKVGQKTATELICKYGSVDGVYEHLDEITKPALHRNLAENEDLARLSKYLVTIKTDCPIDTDWEKAKIGNFYTPEAFTLFTELGLRSFLKDFDSSAAAPAKKEFTYSEIVKGTEASDFLQEVADSLRNAAPSAPVTVGVYLIFDQIHYGSKKPPALLAAAVSTEGKNAVLIPSETGEDALTEADLCHLLGQMRRAAEEANEKYPLGETEPARIAVFDIKHQYPFWDIEGENAFEDEIRLEGMYDLLIMAYLNNPLESHYQPEMVSSEYLGRTLPTWKQLFDKKSPSKALESDRDKLIEYAASLSAALKDAMPAVAERLCRDEMMALYTDIERPLSYVLYDMERIGICLQPEALHRYSDQLAERIDTLTGEIYKDCGEEFNIASPKQLGTVLFEKMGLPGGKKTKTGYSTSADVLEKLAPDYPVVEKILEYRALTKLKSTYADGLTAYVADDGRIHTSFNQTITATGRISSTDPNLQNIPMRTELGKKIRKAFVPAEGMRFVDADYSQIELRILAHMSGDEELIAAYRENQDIHRITASKVFHTPFEDVTSLQRRNAKAVNFGIVYGISSFGLSQDLGITRKEASDYINAYFNTYPQIKEFLDGLVKDAKQNGYAVTLYGRRRPVPELSSSNFMQRSFGERVAMNSPIQGSAADIMKIAMIRVWEALRREKYRSRLILQIHDELLIETAPEEEEKIKELLSREMERAADLSVRLETDVHSGDDWYMAK